MISKSNLIIPENLYPGTNTRNITRPTFTAKNLIGIELKQF